MCVHRCTFVKCLLKLNKTKALLSHRQQHPCIIESDCNMKPYADITLCQITGQNEMWLPRNKFNNFSAITCPFIKVHNIYLLVRNTSRTADLIMSYNVLFANTFWCLTATNTARGQCICPVFTFSILFLIKFC
jgi:hypothetical protein